jgi:FixJ family two-component response regulator
MLNVFLLTYFTKKLDLVIIEKNGSITTKFGEYLQSIFKEVKNYDSQENFLLDLSENNFDILLFDNDIHDIESTFLFIKDVHKINPLIKIILFSKYVDYHILVKCFKYNVTGFMCCNSNEQDLKDFLKISVRRLLLNNSNKFNENKNKFDVIDCLNFLKNEEKDINLVNHFKGIAIIRSAEILDFDNQIIKIKADNIQLKTIKKDTHVVISSIHLGVEILTSAQFVNLEENELHLKYNNLIDSYVHHRKTPRVDPKKGSTVMIDMKNRTLKVDIMNISIDHVLCIAKETTELKIHSTVKILINCNINQRISDNPNYIIKATAFVKEIFSTVDGEKILLKFKLLKEDHKILDKYISFRIKEIIKELKDKSN